MENEPRTFHRSFDAVVATMTTTGYGADYVLSVQRVCARLVAAEVHGEGLMDPVSQIRLVRGDAAPFEGESLADVRRSREREGTVVGLVRDGTVHTDREGTIEAGDELFVAGSDRAIQRFERESRDF